MSECERPRYDECWYSGLPEDHSMEVVVTENPVVAVLYGPGGEVLTEQRQRPPIGFRAR